MPEYEYECHKCGEKFSQRRSFWDKDDDVKCPKCGERKPRRTISSFFSAGGACGPSGESKRSFG